MPVERAAIVSMLSGYLLLPSGMQVDLPLVPPIDKFVVAGISTLLLCWMKGSPTRPPKQRWPGYALGFAFIAAPIFTSFGNSYELQTAKISIPGFYPLDGVKWAGRNAIELIPFYIGARFLWSDKSRILLLKSVAIAGLLYSLPMLFELRMSPQLHRMTYGYLPQTFAMTVRAGGYRPVVFLENGLHVAMFACLAFLAAVVLARGKWPIWQVPAGFVSAYLGMMLLLCKSVGSIVYAAILTPVAMFTRPPAWTKIACVVLLMLCAYPALRWHQLVPVEKVTLAATSISKERSASFETRVDNENQLLARAMEKPWFGWGEWGRNRIYDTYGNDISITDGAWIIQLGTFGWMGYLGLFGLLALGAFRAARSVTSDLSPHNIALGGLSLLLAANAFDLVPNSDLNPITLLVAGSLASALRVRAGHNVRPRASEEPVAVPALVSQ